MTSNPKLYLAGPFFSAEQASFISVLENLIATTQWELFSPRKEENALEMNAIIARGGAPSKELRFRVFNDNWSNIDDADLVLAVIDNFDTGTMWEVGYAFARHVPVATVTNNDYGCNLMLAHSIIGHLKSLASVVDVLRIGSPALALDRSIAEYGAAIAEIQQKYRSDVSLREGPSERDNSQV